MKLNGNFLSNDPHALHRSPRHVEKHLGTLKYQKLIKLHVAKIHKTRGMMAPPSRMELRRSNSCKREKLKP